MKKVTGYITIVIVLLVIAVVGGYAYLSSKHKDEQKDVPMTVVQSTLSRDLSKNYPPTPKEVIRYYNEILRCLYNEESSDEEIESLGLKARELYDEDLLEINELGSYLVKLRADVKDYRDNERRITTFNLAAANNVDFFEEDGYSFARIMCGYNIMQAGKNYSSDQMYLLRKDSNKQWKIYGWEPVENLRVQAE